MGFECPYKERRTKKDAAAPLKMYKVAPAYPVFEGKVYRMLWDG